MSPAFIDDLTAKDCVCRWPRFAVGIVSLPACMPSICGGKLSRGFAESTAVMDTFQSPAQGQPDDLLWIRIKGSAVRQSFAVPEGTIGGCCCMSVHAALGHGNSSHWIV